MPHINLTEEQIKVGDLVRLPRNRVGLVIQVYDYQLPAHCLVKANLNMPGTVIVTGWTYGPFEDPRSYGKAYHFKQYDRVGDLGEFSISELTKLLT